jgi:putative peptide zinc metalloprotease protein
VLVLPQILATAWDSLGLQWNAIEEHWAGDDVSALAVGLLSVLAISLPVLGIAYLLTSLVRRTSRRIWRATSGRPAMRTTAALAGAGLLASLAWAWWPGDQYRPIRADERLAVSDAIRFHDMTSLASFTAYESAGPEPVAAPANTGGEQGRWVLVLVPQTEVPSVGTPPSSGWIFPFDPPREPREGDNQALAVNTEDGSRVFDVALALVWVTDGGPVDQWNDAYALASCVGCQTTAVAFQTIIVVGYAQVVTPVNAAVAVNYACVECITQALALQLVLTLGAMPDDEALADLADVWLQLEQLSENFELTPLDQIYADLVGAQSAILEILEPYQASAAADTTSVDAGAAPAEVQETTADGTTAESGQTATTEAPSTTTETPTTTSETPTTTSEAPTTTAEEPTTTSETEPAPPPPPP